MSSEAEPPAGPIVHLVPALFDARDGIIGGAERYVFELARHMSEVAETRLVTFGSREREERIGSLQIRVIGEPWFVRGQRSNPFSLALLGEIRQARLVHCHQQHVLASSIAALVGRFIGRRVFCTELGGGGWDISSYVPTDRWYHGHLHISEYSRRITGHDREARARVVFGGVDAEKFTPPPTGERERTIVFVGRILPHKGVNDAIDAVDGEVRLEVIGPAHDPRYLSELRRRSEGKNVIFRTNCNDDAIVDAYRRALCVVLPSVYRDMYGGETRVPELLGQTLLEGMACGAAGLCTDVASLPEVVENGVTGLVVQPNDPSALRGAIRWMLDNATETMRMGERGRERVLQRFTWRGVVRSCLEAYAA